MSRQESHSPKPVFSIISLGCPKNLTDSELIVQQLIEAGYQFTENLKKANLVLLNTCGFLQSSRDEAAEILEELLEQKKRGKLRFIFVAGCAVQWEKERLANQYPDVDAWFGVFDEKQIAKTALELLSQQKVESLQKHCYWDSPKKYVFDDSKRHLLTLPHVGYLKIADGCSRCCAYCAIPKIRGPFTSRPRELILDDAKKMADSGVRELIVIAQETNFWGTDLYGKPQLVELLAELQETVAVDWIRLMYTYPLHFSDELILLLGSHKKILPYLDLPLQHVNDTILKAMNRRVDRAKTEELLTLLHGRIENLVLRTSLIVGFPGETEEMFVELMEFVEKWKFTRTGIFAYSREEGTTAATLPNQIPEEIKQQRLQKLYQITDQISKDWAKKQIGKNVDVLIDQPVFDERNRPIPDAFYGRTFADAPTVDPIVILTAPGGAKPGTIVAAEVVETDNMDLITVANH